MLDKLGVRLLKTIKNMCNAESYNILECAELINAVSDKMDVDMLKKYIEHFVSLGYIDVKYSDEKQICLCILPKAKVVDEEIALKQKTNKGFIKLAFIVALIGIISGFVGAFLGSYFYWMIG